MKIDIKEAELIKAIKMLRMLENFPFTETNDSNLMDKQYQLTSWAEELGITISEAMEDEFERQDMLRCPHCKNICIAPPEVFGCEACGYESKRK